MLFRRGHVIAMRKSGAFASGVVWTARGNFVWVSPVCGCNGPPSHRAEVRIDKEDAMQMGVKMKYPVIRCQTMIKLDSKLLGNQEAIGQTPEHVMAKVVRSVTAEARQQAAEARMRYIQIDSRPVFL